MRSKSTSTPPPALQEAIHNSTAAWQADLEALFNHAKDRFPDVVWELTGEDDCNSSNPEQVWGHKAIVYARAPPSFQSRYFVSRPAPVSSPLPYSSPDGTLNAQSVLSLATNPDLHPTLASRSPSPFRVGSPSPSTHSGGILRLTISMSPTLFSNELEYLYTGKGFGEAFEFLFDTSESREQGDAEENRVDKLRKDLVFMWRSRLYSDVRVSLQGGVPAGNGENPAAAVFSSHRFILVSRCSYFHTQLIGWGAQSLSKPIEVAPIKLPSPPFTPASLHFTLGYIYTGTLTFSHRSYDLETAFQIMRSADYLNIQTLYDEIQARIVQEMMHGLFHAFLEFSEYERITSGKWGTGGCRCRQCARRAPRILDFAIQEDVNNAYLQAGARRALVGMFGEGWCNPEFATLSPKNREALLKGLSKRTTPINVFPLLFAAQHALSKLNAVIEPWADTVREMVMSARKVIDDVICNRSEECFDQDDWVEIMNADGVRFEDGEKVEMAMDSVKRGLAEKNAGTLYQTLVSSILLRPHTTDSGATLLSSTSHVRLKVEDTRVYLLRWMQKRYLGIRQAGGFNNLEAWSLKEISSDIYIPVEDLISPEGDQPPRRSGLRPSLLKPSPDNESDLASVKSSILNRNAGKDAPVASSSASIKSAVSRTSIGRPSARTKAAAGTRPDSKLSPLSTSSTTDLNLTTDGRKTPTASRAGPSKPSAVKTTPMTPRPVSTTPSVSSAISTRSQASTLRKPGPSASAVASRRPPSSAAKARPASRAERPVSGVSEASTTFKSAITSDTHLRPALPTRPRTASVSSNMSTVSVKSTNSRVAPSAKATRRSTQPLTDAKSTVNARRNRSPSMSSVKSTASTQKGKAAGGRKATLMEKKPPVPGISGTTTTGTVKGKSRAETVASQGKVTSASSSGSASTVKLKRKGSTDTITEADGPKKSAAPSVSSPLSGDSDAISAPRGATLDIGIPCIVSSKRKRFKAFARYIGEVEGEQGPWVGVEVPMSDAGWSANQADGPIWHDGTWGGIKYFDIGSGGSEWDFGDDRTMRKRRGEWGAKGMKREGDTLSVERTKRFRSASPAASDLSCSETRGLFVRPQQVLYVLDATGD